MNMEVGNDYVRLTELNGRRCDAVMFDYNEVYPDRDSGNYLFSRQSDVIDPESSYGSGFRFDLTAVNVVDANYNDGNDIYYDPNMNNVYGDAVLVDNGVISWSWSEPLYYYGFDTAGEQYDPYPYSAENIWVRVVEDGDYEEPENPDEPTEPDIPEYDGPTIADNLSRIIQAKSDIKQAIENKGVIVGDMTIDNYAEKINEIKGSKWVMPNGTQFYISTFTEFDASLVDISKVTDMDYMFSQCHNLTNINGLETWDVSKVTTMKSMFDGSDLIEFLDLSGWDISNVTDIRSMFKNCKKLNTIKGIENLNTSNVTEMRYVFANCEYLRKIDLSKWDTSKVTNMRNMFDQCIRLTELKMGGDVSNVTDVTQMFYLIKNGGTFYYNPQYDYSKIIAALPSNWTAVPME